MRKILLATLVLLLVMSIACPALADSDNSLCNNGTFEVLDEESGLPVGWYFDAWLAEETDTAMYVAEDSERGNILMIENYVDNDVRLCQDIAAEPDSYYEISCDTRMFAYTDTGIGANISVMDSLAASENVPADGEWHHVTLVGKTGKEQDTLTAAVRFGGYGMLSQGVACFDNVEVIKLEEKPAGAVEDFSAAEAGSGSSSDTVAAGEVPGIGAMFVVTILSALVAVLLYRRGIAPAITEEREAKPMSAPLVILLLVGLLLRCILSVVFVGHSTDVSCFTAWSNAMVQGGPSEFYHSGMFADYPPGYMYVLWFTGAVSKLFGLNWGTAGYILVLKMPAILADLAIAYLLYRFAAKKLSEGKCLLLAGIVLLHPVFSFVSGGWGQIDSVLTLLLLGGILLFVDKKLILAGALYGLAILCKPQALMAGPLFAAAYIAVIPGKEWKKNLLKTILAVLCALAVIVVLTLPFQGADVFRWLYEKYVTTANSYPYASVEAFNLAALVGGNWVSASTKVLFLSYSTWGTLFILLSVAYTVFLYLKGRKNGHGSMMLCAAFLLASVFTTGHYMHERYLFPALVFLLFAFACYRDKRLYISFAGLSIGMLLNVFAAFVIVDHPESRGAQYDALTFIGSLITVISFAYFAYVATDILVRKRVHPAFTEKTEVQNRDTEPFVPLEEPEAKGKLHFTKRDKLYCWILTAVYAVVALLNLGSLQAPETYWLSNGVGEQVEIRFETPAYVDEVRVFGGLTEGNVEISTTDGYSAVYNETNGSMYRWETVGGGFTASEVTLTVLSGQIWLNEIAFFDESGEMISASVVTVSDMAREHGPENLCDEPSEVPLKASYFNGMYFDELYHARTAYEHLEGLEPYENSHPPLGKIFIMLGVAVFGMNAFGWRIVGTLFGIAMVPIMYHFGKRLFKRSEYALLTAVLFAFDLMHFTQTRIATIDVYGVFFIILMYYYMYQYYCMNFYEDGLKATLKPLALAGVFFALGAASKWICFYAGAGLAVILAVSLAQRYLEYRKAPKKANLPFWKNTVKTLLWCCIFFLLIPAAIYLASYLPYVLSEAKYDLEGIWGVQEFMFRYHSGLTATHPFESTWWQWPFTLRPIWYYWGGVTESGASSISAFGNPAVWWVCSIGTIVFIVLGLQKRIRIQKGVFVILVGVAANLMPWMLVTRCTFIYHFFATVPFILLITVYLLSCLERKYQWLGWVKWAWMGLAVALFLLFYPIASGLEVSENYLRALEWFPTWIFIP